MAIDVLLVTALPEERDAAFAIDVGALGPWREETDDAGYAYYLREYQGRHGKLTFALAHGIGMAGVHASALATRLVGHLDPACIAMCGVCAGRIDDTGLGDVVIADRVFQYDQGKISADAKGTEIARDLTTFNLYGPWHQKALNFDPRSCPSWRSSDAELARWWILERLFSGDDPHKHPARKRYCPDELWPHALDDLTRAGLIRFGPMGKIEITEPGTESVVSRRIREPWVPAQLPFAVLVGPVASGNMVVADASVQASIARHVRKVLGIEMEAGSIGTVAHLENRRFFIAKGVMDHSDGRKDDRYKAFAARASAEVTFRFLLDNIEGGGRKKSPDEQKLEDRTESALTALGINSGLPTESGPVTIVRTIVEEIEHRRRTSSVLVTGDPGAGKTGVLVSVARRAQAADARVVFLSAAQLPAASEGQLRDELGLESDVLTLVRDLSDGTDKLLVLDGLDAASGDRARYLWVQLAQVAQSLGWTVVAAVRTWDLSRWQPLKTAFPSAGLVTVPSFSDSELGQLNGRWPILEALLNEATPVLREILSLPFHLRLAAELLHAGVDPDEIRGWATASQILEGYWTHRITDKGAQVVQSICLRILARHSLEVSADGLDAESLAYCLSSGVIVEGKTNSGAPNGRIRFFHQILFDFIVSRSLMRQLSPVELASFLSTNKDAIFLIRPALRRHLVWTWNLDASHAVFWDSVSAMTTDRSLGAAMTVAYVDIAIERGRALRDFIFLCDAWANGDRTARSIAVTIAMALNRTRYSGSRLSEVWFDVFEYVSRRMKPDDANFLLWWGAQLEDSTDVALRRRLRGTIVFIARQLDPRSISAGNRRSLAALLAKTLDGAAADNSVAIEWLIGALDPTLLTGDGLLVVRELGFAFKSLLANAFGVAELLSALVFNLSPKSEDITFAGSITMAFNQDSREIVRSAAREVLEALPSALLSHSLAALPMLIGMLRTATRRIYGDERFEAGPQGIEIQADSGIDIRTRFVRDEDTIRDAFTSFVERFVADSGQQSVLSVIAVMRAHKTPAALYRTLFDCAAKHPKTMGLIVFRAIWDPWWISCYLVRVEFAKLAGAVFGELTLGEQADVEKAIFELGTPAQQKPESSEHYQQDRMLRELAQYQLKTPELSARIEILRGTNDLKNDPPITIGDWKLVDEEERLRDQGIDTTQGPEHELLEIRRESRRLREPGESPRPATEELQLVERAFNVLQQAGLSDTSRSEGWNRAAADLSEFVKRHIGESKGILKERILALLKIAVAAPEPCKDRDRFVRGDDTSVMLIPDPRCEAVDLICIVEEDHPAPEWVDQLETLSTDPCNEVRYRVAYRLDWLAAMAPELSWRVAERIVSEENDGNVLVGFLSRVLVLPDPLRVQAMLLALVRRLETKIVELDLVASLIQAFAGLYVDRGFGESLSEFQSLVRSTRLSPGQLGMFVRSCSGHFDIIPPPGHDLPRAKDVRLLELLDFVLEEQIKWWNELPTSTEVEKSRRHVEALQQASSLISHAFQLRQGQVLSSDERATRLYGIWMRLRPIIARLAPLGLPGVTRDIVEGLSRVWIVDPKGALRVAREALVAAQRYGYQFDFLAGRDVTAFVERALSRRDLVQSDQDYREDIRLVLDTFAAANSPEMLDLLYDLDAYLE